MDYISHCQEFFNYYAYVYILRLRLVLISILGSLLVFLPPLEKSIAATYQVGSGVCQQIMDTNTATVYQSGINSSECVIQFKNIGTVHWTVPNSINVNYLIVGGGGSSSRGSCSYWYGPGGGGGGVESGTSLALSSGVSETITVGSGGFFGSNSGCTSAGDTGTASVFHSITARGGAGATATSPNGGASGNLKAGGLGTNICPTCDSGGGGGAGGNGVGMVGGSGLSSSITDTATVYGSGGAGRNSGSYGTASNGGGLANGVSDGSANTGGGGADPINGTGLGNGGSGIVVIRYAYNLTTSLGAISVSGIVKKMNNVTLSIVASTPGLITFYASGRPINRCMNLATDGNLTVSCAWKVITSGQTAISVRLSPTLAALNRSTQTSNIVVGKRSTSR